MAAGGAAGAAGSATCGTTLTYQDDRSPDELDITSASLDDPDSVPPQDHTFVQERLAWMRMADGLPEHARTRAESDRQQGGAPGIAGGCGSAGAIAVGGGKCSRGSRLVGGAAGVIRSISAGPAR